MNLTDLNLPSFKKKQIDTTEVNKGHEAQPFVDLVIFCSKTLFLAGALLFLGLTTSVQAQFTYTSNNGTITITGYTGSAGMVTIPGMIDGLAVTDIGTNAFQNTNGLQGSALTSVSIPDSVTNIGDEAFYGCDGLTNVTFGDSITSIGNYAFSGQFLMGLGAYLSPPLTIVTIPSSVTNIGIGAFEGCPDLINVTIPGSVISIGNYAFFGCQALTNVTMAEGLASIGAYAFSGSIGNDPFGPPPPGACPLNSITIPDSVTNIGDHAFVFCDGLTNAYFLGNAPSADSTVFLGDSLTAYYLPGTTGWANFTTNTGVPTSLWTLPYPLVLNGSFGVLNSQFGFTISWATNVPVVVQASTDLSNRVWTPIATNTLTGGTSYFSDSQWTNYPARFYRLSQ
jgi:hypothetical protein